MMTRVEVAEKGNEINCNNNRRLGLLGATSATKNDR